MKEIRLVVFVAIGMTTTLLLFVRATLWFVDLGNAFISKYKK